MAQNKETEYLHHTITFPHATLHAVPFPISAPANPVIFIIFYFMSFIYSLK